MTGIMEAQACVRGFSFMPKKSIEFLDLKYVEKEALEQTWKMTRRQRLKQQEQKIWDQFVQERDIISSVCKDDPYQFLHQLPESCIKELLEEELQKMRNEHTVEKTQEQEEQGEVERAAAPAPDPDPGNQHVVTFVEDEDREDMFHIFDDEKDDEISGPDEEALNESAGSPPCTVRERRHGSPNKSPGKSPDKSLSPDKASSKSSENVTDMIESSIYCARVKELRMKINEELLDIAATLERMDLTKIEPEDQGRLLKRSSEFCARFNRIYLYQLHRQVREVRRGAEAAAALPFARHTQFQSQMVRVVSLHQNMLQTAQVFHKSIGQTACIRDSGEVLRTLLRTVAEAGAASRDTVPPGGLAAAQDLYTDEIVQTCSKLEGCLNEYTKRLTEYFDNFAHTGKSRNGINKARKGKSVAARSKAGTRPGAEMDARLSMYSLDTLRLNLHSKSTVSKGHSSGTSKARGGHEAARDQPAASAGRSPRSRRPLMRDPAAGGPRRKHRRDLDVRTLVETVADCTSIHISREDTPQQTPRDSGPGTPRRGRDAKGESSRKHDRRTPRRKNRSPNKHVARLGTEKHEVEPTDEVKLDSNIESIENRKLAAHEIKIELKPKSPDKIIENTLRAAKDHVDGARTRKHDTDVETKRARDGGDLKYGFGPGVGGGGTSRECASPQCERDGNADGGRSDGDRYKVMDVPGSCEVSKLLHQLCGGDVTRSKNERGAGVKNAQLLCVNSGGSPRQPSTPQLLRILEETIQKKAPKPLLPKPSARDAEKMRLTFDIPERTTENLFRYRTKFVQHMLTSSMYANSAVGKPWEMIGSVSDQIIDELLLGCAKEMELRDIVQELYASETR